MSENIDRALALLDHWRGRARTLQKLHYDRVEYFEARHRAVGVPAVILAGVSGTSVLVSLVTPLGTIGTMLVGFAALVSAALSLYQTTVRFEEQAQKHRAAAVGYGAVNRALENALTLPPAGEDAVRILVDRIEDQLNQLAQHVPALPRSVFNNVPAEYHPPEGQVPLRGEASIVASQSRSATAQRPLPQRDA